MEGKYITSSGKILSIYLWSDILGGNTWRDHIEVCRIRHKKKCKPFDKALFSDAKGVYIVYDSEKIYLEDFVHSPAETLIANIKKYQETSDYSLVCEDDILATIMKEHDKIAFVAELPVYTTIIPQVGIALCGDKEAKALCVLTEKRYKKGNWSHKVTVEAMNPAYRSIMSSRDFYLSDFCSLILRGHITMVMKDQYVEEHNQKIKERSTFIYKIKNLFKSKKDDELVIV